MIRVGDDAPPRWDLGRNGLVVASVMIGLLSIAHILYYAPRTVDDMFIFLRYAENLAGGAGLVYNPGERVEGFSSPLWVGLLALGELAGVGGVTWTKLLALVAWGFLLGGVYRFGRELLSMPRWLACIGCVSLVLNSYVVSWTMWGLETPAYLALMMWVAVLARRVTDGASRSQSIALATVGAAFVLCRPEAPLFIALIGVAVAVRSVRWSGVHPRVRRALPAASVVVGVFVTYSIFRRLYFGLWLPHTHYAKHGDGLDPRHLAPLVSQGASAPELVLFVAGALAALWLLVRRRSGVPMAVIAGSAFFVSLVPLDWMPNVRHFLPIQIVVPLSVLAAARALLDGGTRLGRTAAGACIAIVLAAAALTARVDSRFSPNDFALHGRGQSWTRPKTLESWTDTWACLGRRRPEHIEGMDRFHNGMITLLYQVIEADSRPLSETWSVARDIGRVGWLSPVRVFDTDGLFTPDVVQSEAWRRGGAVDQNLIGRAFDRDVVMTDLFGPWGAAILRDPDVRNRYRPNPDWEHVSASNRSRPEMELVLSRYERALEKMPKSYYLMTLYGEGVGAALERRVEHVRAIARDHPTATVETAPESLEGGPTVLDRSIELLGCEVEPARIRPGGEVLLVCYFRAIHPVPRDYTVFVHVDGLDGNASMQGDHAPADGFFPTTRWTPGIVVRDAYRLRIPEDTGASRLQTFVGLYIGDHRAVADPGAPVDAGGRAIGPVITVER